MTIKDGDFIKVSYTGKLEDGTIFDTTNEEVAKVHNIYNLNARYGGDVIIIGANHIIPGLEEDIKQHDAGYEGTVSIPPEKAFGERNPKLIKDLPIKRFQEPPQEGMQVQIGGRIGTVLKVRERHARVDFNSPMAGQTVIYDYRIDTVIEDVKEKAVGLSTLYTGQEMDIEVEGTVAKINVPLKYSHAQNWTDSKVRMALELLKYTELTEVQYIETYSKDLLNEMAQEPEKSEATEAEFGED